VTEPLAMNHIGINVPDIRAAVEWYKDIFGAYVLTPVSEAKIDGSHLSDVIEDIFGKDFESMLIAHLVTADGTGLEFFQFQKPKTEVPANTYEYWRSGIFHFCLTSTDVEGTVAKIRAKGGKALSKIWKIYANKPYLAVYCQDPWGTVIELYNASYEQYWANTEPFELIKK
jgi:catechol 2,3-dioxygenase-like lactoylglutathione lyase family enzyme